ncbi:LysR family transcriptional regulator [Streptomyces tanashiensis]
MLLDAAVVTSSYDIDPRLLRAFTAVAEELHFTRAAARLYLAQQALSRDIRRLERELGTELFVRTTRQVALTPDGERLLPYARRVLAAHDELSDAFRAAPRPLLVDLNSPDFVQERVLLRARELAPEQELMARYESGLTGAAQSILAGRIDTLLRPVRRARRQAQGGARLPVRPLRADGRDPPEDHPLAVLPEVPLARLAGERIYAGADDRHHAEWTDLAARLFAGRGIAIAPARAPWPSATRSSAGSGRRPPGPRRRRLPAHAELRDPATRRPRPLSPVSLVWRKGLRHPGLDALRRAAAELGGPGRLARPPTRLLAARGGAGAARVGPVFKTGPQGPGAAAVGGGAHGGPYAG